MSTAPAETGVQQPVFGLRKTWVDTEPGIAMVQIHYAWTPPGGEPDWESAPEGVLVPRGDPPGLRSAILEVPRFVDGASSYLLHHFFFVVRAADRVATPVFTEEIVSREVTHEDATGAYTHVGIAWGTADDEAVTNYTSAAMDGLSFQSPGADAEHRPGAIYEFVQAQPLPHVFRGLVWGPRGSRVRYVLHLVRRGSPDTTEDAESWDDNRGAGWVVEL